MYVRKPGEGDTKLTLIRLQKGLTRKQLAEKSGLPMGTIERWEHHRSSIKEASLWRVLAVAEALEVPVEDLID